MAACGQLPSAGLREGGLGPRPGSRVHRLTSNLPETEPPAPPWSREDDTTFTFLQVASVYEPEGGQALCLPVPLKVSPMAGGSWTRDYGGEGLEKSFPLILPQTHTNSIMNLTRFLIWSPKH